MKNLHKYFSPIIVFGVVIIAVVGFLSLPEYLFKNEQKQDHVIINPFEEGGYVSTTTLVESSGSAMEDKEDVGPTYSYSTDPKALGAVRHLRSVYSELLASRSLQYNDTVLGVTIYLLDDEQFNEECAVIWIEGVHAEDALGCYGPEIPAIFLRAKYFETGSTDSPYTLDFLLYHEYGHHFMYGKDIYPYVNTPYGGEVAANEFAQWVIGGGERVSNGADKLFEKSILKKI